MADTHNPGHASVFLQGQILADIAAMKKRLVRLEDTLTFLVKENASLWVECKRTEVMQTELDKQIARRFEAQQIALDKAEHAMTLRLETMNEFREQITRERALYITRDQLDLSLKLLDARITPVQTAQTFLHGRDATLWALLSLGVALLALVLPLLLRLGK